MARETIQILEHGVWVKREVTVPDKHPLDNDHEGRVEKYLTEVYGNNWKPLFETASSRQTADALRAVRKSLTQIGLHADSETSLFSLLNHRTKRKKHQKYPRQ